MPARLSLASLLLGGCALLVYPAAAQQPGLAPKGGPRVHVDPGYHVGRVEYLCFRDKDGTKDAELVSVGSDRSARVWDLDPKGGAPRSKRAFFFPDIPTTASLNPNNEKRHLAVGFYRRDGDPHPKVRIIDLDDAPVDGPVRPREADIKDDFAAVSGVHFDHRGDHLIITGGAGNLWQWSDWRKTAEPKRVPVPPLSGHAMTAVAFQSEKSQWVAAAGWLGEDAAKKANITPAYLCIAPFDGKNIAAKNGKPDWRILPLPGREPLVFSLDWKPDRGLAVGYFTQEGKLVHARVAVFPAKGAGVDEKNPIDADLGVGFTSRVTWMPAGMLLATIAQDGFNPLPPEFLKVDDGKLVRVPRNDVFPGLDRHPARQGNGAGLSVCAVGTGDNPLPLAWGGYAQGTIELARVRFAGGRKPELVSLDPVRRENWYMRLGWESKTGEIVLTGPGGRRVAISDDRLWGGVKLSEGLTAQSVSYAGDASAGTNLVVCRSNLPGERQLVCDSSHLYVSRLKDDFVFGNLLFPGGRSLLTFSKEGEKEEKQPRTAVVLGSDGELTFWEHQPKERGPSVLKQTATAALKGGRLEFHFPDGLASTGNGGRMVRFDESGPDDVLVRTPPPPGANDPQPADIVRGLDPDLVLPAGKHAFTVRAPHAGILHIQVTTTAGKTREVLPETQVKSGPVSIKAYPFNPDDCVVEVKLRPLKGNRAITTRHEIQVRKPGKVVLFDIVPQVGHLCTDKPEPTPETQRPYRPTADALAKILEKLTGGPVERHSAATRDGGTHTATAAAAEARIRALVADWKIGADDCFILLLKGHGKLHRRGPTWRAIFETDDFDEARAKDGQETGLTHDKLAELLTLVGTRTDKIVVILDCCKAENFLDTLHARPITFYPCCLRGSDTQATVLPDALAQILTRIEDDFPNGLVTQGDLLRVLREECSVQAKDWGKHWGYGAVPHRFVLANRNR